MATIIQPEKNQGANEASLPRNNSLQAGIAIDNNTFDDAHDFAINVKNIQDLLIQIQNVGSANLLSYEVYGSIDPATTPPAFGLKVWNLLENGASDLSSETNEVFDNKLNWLWILIRLKRQTADVDTIATIRTTSGVK